MLLSRPVKISDVWKAAIIRLGATESEALLAVDNIRQLAKSRADFDRWNERLPDNAGQALLKGIASLKGVDIARDILADFAGVVVREYGIERAELERIFRLRPDRQ